MTPVPVENAAGGLSLRFSPVHGGAGLARPHIEAKHSLGLRAPTSRDSLQGAFAHMAGTPAVLTMATGGGAAVGRIRVLTTVMAALQHGQRIVGRGRSGAGEAVARFSSTRSKAISCLRFACRKP